MRVVASVLAITLTIGAAWCLYQAFFVLERFGLMSILLAFALLLLSAVLWWWFAEGGSSEVRRRILHVIVGGAIGSVIVTGLLFADPAFRQRPPSLHLSDLAFHAWFDTGPVGFIIGSYFGFLYSLFRLRSTQPSNQALEPTAGRRDDRI
jgi:hypothetical protein